MNREETEFFKRLQVFILVNSGINISSPPYDKKCIIDSWGVNLVILYQLLDLPSIPAIVFFIFFR